ncbi:uncharacterized protein LOC128997514 [Macrosteles quadrilineatus]|uniref:uncharacterized protein LOC128997514 n=1 Tax=Macrosteles quadrilineatus TaxID=74068 RepID=UPI0023E0EE37|nr:uncharacterized protein LOC128997514 [Macrosteles quadrilineatus]
MTECCKCNVECNENSSDVISCVECSDVMHVQCAGPDLKRKTRNRPFKCGKCNKETASMSSVSDTEDSTVLKAINSLHAKFSDTLDQKLSGLEGKINDSICEKLDVINERINTWQETITSSLSGLKSENILLKQECVNLKSRCDDLSKQVDSVTEQLQDLQQYSRIDNLEVVGVPLTKNEDVYAVLKAVANTIGTPWKYEDISIAHRVPSTRQKHPNIIVKFTRRASRMTWLLAAKEIDLTAKMVHPSFPDTPIFINEHLTGHAKETLNCAKKLVKEKKLAYAWVKEGKILVRKTADGKPARVRSPEDVKVIAAQPAAQSTAQPTAQPTAQRQLSGGVNQRGNSGSNTDNASS